MASALHFFLASCSRDRQASDRLPVALNSLAELLQENFPVIFNGDGYSAEWVEEAERRGLPNLNNATKALTTLASDKNKKIFSATQVLQPHELEARKDVMLGEIANTLLIEARTSLRMVDTAMCLPSWLTSNNIKMYNSNLAIAAKFMSPWSSRRGS